MQAVSTTRAVDQPALPQAEDAIHLALSRSQIRATLRGHTKAVTTVIWSLDGRLLVTTSEDATAKLWDFPGGTERLSLHGHTGALTGAAFSPKARLSGQIGAARPGR